MMMAFSLVACGSKTSTTDTSNEPGEETWAEITQDQVKADFAAKGDAPWNHVEVTDTLIHQELQKIMLISSSLVEGEWKLETLKVDGENVDDVGGLAPEVEETFILSQEGFDIMPAEVAWQKSNKGNYSCVSVFEGDDYTTYIKLDCYFYMTYVRFEKADNIFEIITVEWSVK